MKELYPSEYTQASKPCQLKKASIGSRAQNVSTIGLKHQKQYGFTETIDYVGCKEFTPCKSELTIMR